MAYSSPTSVQTARTAFVNARRVVVDKLHAYEKAQAVLKEKARQLSGAALLPFEDALDFAASDLQNARINAATEHDALQTAIATWLSEGTSEEADLSRLLSSDPIVLFPVRLETRFDGTTLRVRMFPDEIFLNTHETALTEEEYDAAKSYYDKLNRDGNEAALWRDMVARFGSQRSAYLLRHMLPVFGDARPFTDWWSSSSTCGGTVTGALGKELSFPDDLDPNAIQFRSASWTQPGEAILPDRWVVITHSRERRLVSIGSQIPEPLALTPDPHVQESDMVVIPGTTLKIDKRVLWTVDYQSAVASGMALDIPMVGDELVHGFDRVIAIGVKTSMDPVETSRHLEKLLDAHHYTRGVALVQQGSPTNNMEGQPTSYPPRDNAGTASFIVERQPAPVDRERSHHCLPEDTDGWALATTLGVPSGVFANVARSRHHEIVRAKQMNTVLWPGTIGYFLRNLMAPVFTWQDVKNAREYFQRFVIARGPAPAFRIGATPYGVLPIFSLKDWQNRDYSNESSYDDTVLKPVEKALLEPLRKLLGIWETAIEHVPTIRSGRANPDVDVAKVLSTTPSSKQFWLRKGLGPDVYGLYYWINGWDHKWYVDWMDRQARDVFTSIGYPNWKPRIGQVTFKNQAWVYTGNVVAASPREDRYLEPNFLYGLTLAEATPTEVLYDFKPYATPSLFFKVVRHSVLLEYLYGYLDRHNLISSWVEREYYGIPSWTSETSLLVGQLLQNANSEYTSYAKPMLDALGALSGESTAELERLFTETLDLSSHRLDAWVTAFAYRRLSVLRRAQVGRYQMPRGNTLGGYGWLEDVRPRTVELDPHLAAIGITAEVRQTNGGFVHTPSLTHAAAAAVLRNAHMGVKQYDPASYALDLSSRRVRNARWLFDGVRAGQPLGALMGYQFELGLHENHRSVPGIDRLRFTFRNLYPLVAKQSGNDPNVPAEAIAARNVVDGCALLRAYQAGKLTGPEVPTPTSNPAQYEAMKAELDKLAELYDATADVLTAESVFQLVSGNVDAAVPTINNVAKGKQPPTSVFTRSARGGVGISHRVALVFPHDVRPVLDAHWPTTLSPRAQGEPVLNAWLGELIGSPANVSCTLTYWDEEGAQIPNTQTGSGGDVVTWVFGITLEDLGIHPLDLLAITEAVAHENQGSMLDRQIIAAAYANPLKAPDSKPAIVKIEYQVTSGRSFPEVLEVLNTAGAVIRSSRPLAIADLLPPAEIESGISEDAAEPIGGTNAVAFYDRADAVRVSFAATLSQLETAIGAQSGYRSILVEVARYLPFSAYPDPTVTDPELKDQAEAAWKELKRRAATLPTPLDTTDPDVVAAVPSARFIAEATRILKGIFGSNFVALPEVDPPRSPEVDQSLLARGTLLGPNNDDAPEKYLQQIAHARERLARFRKLGIYARASGVGRPRVDIVQLPYVPGERWLGMKFVTPPSEGRAALLLVNYAPTLQATESWVGLVVDDWSEMIPNQTEQTGIALHYEGPQAQAPQAILVATPSRNSDLWSFGELANSVEQTMKLTKIRGVDLEHLNLGQVLPMTNFATATHHHLAISTVFDLLRRSIFTRGLNDD